MAYSYYRSIVIDNTKVSGSGNISNYIYTFNSTNASFKTSGNGGKLQNSNGYDFAFFSDSGLTIQLDHHVLKYVATTGEIVAKVRIPTLLYSSDTTIYIGYGDSGISSSQESIASVYASGYKAYYNFDPGFSGSDYLLDATSNNNDLTNSGTDIVDGTVGKGRDFVKANSDYAYAADSAELDIVTSISFRMWLNPDDATPATNMEIFSKGRESGGGSGPYLWRVDSGGTITFYFYNSGTVNGLVSDTVPLSDGVAAHIYFQHDYAGSSSDTKLLVNGSVVSCSETPWSSDFFNNTPTATSERLQIGALFTAGTPNYFLDGILDDFFLYEGLLTSDWAITDYNNTNSPSTFYTLGSETSTGGGGSTFKPKILIY